MAKKVTNINPVNQGVVNTPVSGVNENKIATNGNSGSNANDYPTLSAKDLENYDAENINMPVYIKPVNNTDGAKYHFTDPNKKDAITGVDDLDVQNGDNYNSMQKTVYANNPVSAKDVDDTAIKENLPGPKSYADLVAAIYKQSEPTPEQEEKLRKRQKAMTILGALSDGIAGMANIFAANKGALPVKHDPVTRELDARYQKLLDERQRRRDKWGDMQIHASMSDLSNKLQTERENRQYAYADKAASLKYSRDKEMKGYEYLLGMNKQRDQQNFESGQTDKKLNHETEKTKYIQGQTNIRSDKSNAATIKAAEIRRSADGSGINLIDSTGTVYNANKKWLDANYGALYRVMSQELENNPNVQKPFGLNYGPPSESQQKAYILNYLGESPMGQKFMKTNVGVNSVTVQKPNDAKNQGINEVRNQEELNGSGFINGVKSFLGLDVKKTGMNY